MHRVLRDLFNHMEWADARVWQAALGHEPAATDDTLRWLLLHLHTVQQAFLDAWTGQPPTFRETFADAMLARELPAVRRYHQRAIDFFASVTDRELAAPMALPWLDWVEQRLGRKPGQTTLGETIVQVHTHSAYHRGQVNMRLRALGAEPPLVDYIAWLWLDGRSRSGLRTLTEIEGPSWTRSTTLFRSGVLRAARTTRTIRTLNDPNDSNDSNDPNDPNDSHDSTFGTRTAPSRRTQSCAPAR